MLMNSSFKNFMETGGNKMLQSKFEKKELESKSVEELRKICRENGVSYHEHGKRLNKGSMISKMLTDILEEIGESGHEEDGEIDETLKKEQIAVEEAERLEKKKRYIEDAKIGTIVAFKLPNGKVISAAITKKSTSGRKFMVETKYGAQYKISFDDVLWVKTVKRWPKGIYLLFKQNDKMGVTKDGEEIS